MVFWIASSSAGSASPGVAAFCAGEFAQPESRNTTKPSDDEELPHAYPSYWGAGYLNRSAPTGLTPCGAGDYGEDTPDDLEGSSAMNKGGLVAEVSKRTGLSKADVGRVVDASIDYDP